MHTKAPPPIDAVQGRLSSALLRTYFEANHLKHLFRQGWLRVGVPQERCESVAEHSFFVALLGLLVTEQHFPELDSAKVVKLALLHDLGEAVVGDLTPHHAVSREEKHALERAALARVLEGLPQAAADLALWDEYEAGATAEARLVKQLDRLEMALQACVYEHRDGLSLEEFYESAARALAQPELKQAMAELQRARPAP